MGKSAKDKWLGKEFVSKTGKRCIITEYKSCYDVTIRFEDGVEIHRDTASLRKYPPCHPQDNPTLPTMRVGDVYKSNKYGKVEVIKYCGVKNVTIRFVEYNNEEIIAQAVNIRSGFVAPDSITIKTLEKWKEVAGRNHNNKYDYSHITVKPKHNDRVLVKCLMCGDFIEVAAEDHLFGKGYCLCERQTEIDNYFTEVSGRTPHKLVRKSFTRTSTDQSVIAFCEQHGEFPVTVGTLLKGGICCPKCKMIEYRQNVLNSSKDKLQGVEVLGYTEDLNYILLNTTTGEIKVYSPSLLISIKYNPFLPRQIKQKVTFDVFLERANKVHGNAYSYSNYKSINEKLTVTHKECGNTYEQWASGHISGNYGKGVGCPHCAKYGLSLSRQTNLYIFIGDNGYIKVGITHQTPEGRIRQIHKSSRPICLFSCYRSWSMVGADAITVEKELLSLLGQRYKQPKELFDGSTETFIGTSAPDVEKLVIKILEDNHIQLL